MFRTLVGSGVLVALALGLSRIAPAEDKSTSDDLLAYVPADAAFFAQVNVAEVWKSQAGDSIRAAKIVELEKLLAYADGIIGLKPEDIRTANVFFPSTFESDSINKFGVTVALNKPLDKGRVITGLTLADLAMEGKMAVSEKDGILTINLPPDLVGGPRKPTNEKKDEKPPQVVVDWKNPKLIRIFVMLEDKYRKPAAAGAGPLAPAFAAAKAGKSAAIGFNFAALPAEVREIENLPAEVRPFGPLIKSDAMFASGQLAEGKLALDVRFRSSDKLVVRDAEKSLAAGVNLFTTLSEQGIKEFEKEEKQKPTTAVFKGLVAMLSSVKIRTEGTDAIAVGNLPLDLPYGPALAAQFSGGADTPGGRAARARSQNNLKQLALGLHNFESAHGHFPPAAICSKKGKPLLSWRVAILPYIEQDALYKQFKLDEPWDSEHNLKLAHPVRIKTFMLPGVNDDGKGLTHYQLCVGNGAGFDKIQPMRFTNFTDGTSNTLLIATAAKPVFWSKPDDIEFDPKSMDIKSLFHFKDAGDVCNISMADGSVRALRKSISPETLKAVITRSGGEVVADLDK